MARKNFAAAFETPEKGAQSAQDTNPAPKAKEPRKAAQKRAQKPPAATTSPTATREPSVRGVATDDAKRVTLYLHPDDYEFIRYDMRGGDIQSVMRSLIACARADDRLRTKVSRLSREAPRGGGN